jgi:hypothetical protein
VNKDEEDETDLTFIYPPFSLPFGIHLLFSLFSSIHLLSSLSLSPFVFSLVFCVRGYARARALGTGGGSRGCFSFLLLPFF